MLKSTRYPKFSTSIIILCALRALVVNLFLFTEPGGPFGPAYREQPARHRPG